MSIDLNYVVFNVISKDTGSHSRGTTFRGEYRQLTADPIPQTPGRLTDLHLPQPSTSVPDPSF